MVKKNLILFLVFYLLILFQTSFLSFFEISNQTLNLVLIFLFLIIFFSPPLGGEVGSASLEIPWEGVSAGFFLDLFSHYPIGLSIFLLSLEVLLIKEILKNLKAPGVFVFIFLFLVFQCFFDLSLFVFGYFFKKPTFLSFNRFFLMRITYNLLFAIFGFYFTKRLICLGKNYKNYLKGKK